MLEQIRQAQRGLSDAAEWERTNRAGQVAAVQQIVERVGYDGIRRQVSIRFHPPVLEPADQETRA